MPDWVGNLIGFVVTGVVSGTGIGAWAAWRKERREQRLAPLTERITDANLTEQLQRLAAHAVEQIRKQMEEAEEEHTRQLTGVRLEQRRLEGALARSERRLAILVAAWPQSTPLPDITNVA